MTPSNDNIDNVEIQQLNNDRIPNFNNINYTRDNEEAERQRQTEAREAVAEARRQERERNNTYSIPRTWRSNTENNIDSTMTDYLSVLLTVFVQPLKQLICKLKKTVSDLTQELGEKDKVIDEKDKVIEKLENTCTICLMDRSQYIFIPCGHFCMCNTCTAQYKDYNFNWCPVCRREGDTFRVFSH